MAKKKSTITAKTSKANTPQKPPHSGKFLRYSVALILAGAAVLVWMSLLTYNSADMSPAISVPAGKNITNAAGYVGAWVASKLITYLGRGAHVGMLFATIAYIIVLFRRRIAEVPRRVVGVVILTAATGAAVYMTNPAAADASGPEMSMAGVVGAWSGQRLLMNFAPTGGWVVMIVVFSLGILLSSDRLLVLLYHLFRRLWHRRDKLVAVGAKYAEMRRAKAEAVAAAAAAAAAAAPAPSPAQPQPKVPTRPPAPAPVPTPASAPAPQPQASKAARPLAAPAPAKRSQPAKSDADGDKGYVLPSYDLLAEPTRGYAESQESNAWEKRTTLQRTLTEFNVEAEVVGHMTGPVITMFELSLAPGVKVSQVARLSNDISRALAVPNVRVVSPLPGRDTIGIEVPNMDKEIVRIRELMDMEPEAENKMFIPLYLGKDAEGKAIVSDLAKMPHMLIAGTTGSGKSVCINSIIVALLLKRTPEDLRLILIDPKMVEMAAFENIPHLLCPIVNDMRRAEDILEWAATKMDERYELLREAGVKNIASYNTLAPEELYDRCEAETDEEKARIPLKLPYYVIIVDELADLIMTSSKEVEGHIIRIAQKARAVGIHLILATQRPSVNVVTGLIKSNMPCRASFRVASRQESRIVLDQNGAEVLLGQGDMLFLQPGTSNLLRAQGTYVDDLEIRPVVKALKKAREVIYNPELIRLTSRAPGDTSGEKDELFDKAVEVVLRSKRGSVSLLQRRLSIGYSRASRIIDQMADAGMLGDYKGSQARECLITLDDWQSMQQSIVSDQSGKSSMDGTPTSA